MDHLINFHQITESIATAGQPTSEQIKEIAENGYCSVINLAMHDSDDAIPREGCLVTSQGMSYFHIPVPFENPQARHIKQFFALMDMLEGEKTFVHCALNARVSAFMYLYLTLKKGSSTAEAESPLLAQWRTRMNPTWQSILELSLEEIESS